MGDSQLKMTICIEVTSSKLKIITNSYNSASGVVANPLYLTAYQRGNLTLPPPWAMLFLFWRVSTMLEEVNASNLGRALEILLYGLLA